MLLMYNSIVWLAFMIVSQISGKSLFEHFNLLMLFKENVEIELNSIVSNILSNECKFQVSHMCIDLSVYDRLNSVMQNDNRHAQGDLNNGNDT